MNITADNGIVLPQECELISIAEIKIKCFDFAIEVTKAGIYKPSEVLQEAILIFNWITDNK